MRTQVRMSEPMGARLTSHLASPLVVATPGRVAHWLRVKTENPEEWRGRESERERERERERGERLLHFAARGNKKERTTNTYCTLAAERRRNGKTDGTERAEFSPVLDLVFLFLSREEIDAHYTHVHYLSFFKKI